MIDTYHELIAGQISQGKRAKKLVRQCGSVMKSRIRKMKRQWNNMNPFRVNSFVPFRLLYENHVALKYRKLGIKPTGEKGYPTCMLFIDGVKKMYIIKPFIKISEWHCGMIACYTGTKWRNIQKWCPKGERYWKEVYIYRRIQLITHVSRL